MDEEAGRGKKIQVVPRNPGVSFHHNFFPPTPWKRLVTSLIFWHRLAIKRSDYLRSVSATLTLRLDAFTRPYIIRGSETYKLALTGLMRWASDSQAAAA